ncbi:MAG: hypothetical protein ACLUFW_10700 [Alistipes sp.]
MYIGTGGHGHVFMGANVPFGAVQLGPTSIPQSWDWMSGYHISDTTVIGFSHTHLERHGYRRPVRRHGDARRGQVTYARGTEDDPQSGHVVLFQPKNEKARPGYYATRLDRYGVDVELTATKRVGLHKYTFPASAGCRRGLRPRERRLLGLGRPKPAFERADGPYGSAATATRRAGPKTSGSTSRPNSRSPSRIASHLRWRRETAACAKATAYRAERRYARVGVRHDSAGEPIYVKVAISPVSIENATPEHAGRASRLGLRSRRPQPPTGRGTPSCRRCASRLRTTPHAAFSIRRFTTRWSPRPSSAT